MDSRTRRLRTAAWGLFAALAAAYGAFSWREAEERVLDAAAAEGRAVLASVAAGVEANLAASRAVERLLAEGVTAEAARICAALAAVPGDETAGLEEALHEDALHDGRLVGALLLGPEGEVVASADVRRTGRTPLSGEGPITAERVDRLDRDELLRRVRGIDLGPEGSAVVRFGEGPFVSRDELVVAVRCPDGGGTLVLRADAASLERFERDAGVRRHLTACADSSAVAYLALQAEDGTVLAGSVPAAAPPPSDRAAWRTLPAGARVLDVAFPSPWEGPPSGWLRIGLDAAPVEDVLFRARRNVGVLTLLAAGAGLAGMLALSAFERRRRAEESRFRAEIERRERFVALGSLAAGVAHDIRGPLNAISLAAQLLDREARPTDAAARELFAGHLASLRNAVRRADANVAEFLALGRGGTEPVRAPVDVGRVVRTALASEGFDAGADFSGATGPVVEDGGTLIVEGDERTLVRAVANVLRNARQWAALETVRVAWRREGADAVIEVSDGGPGIPASERERVFEPFRTTRPDGTGLGLAVVRDAVVRHGGTVTADESPSGGARFRIRLPVHRSGP